MNETTKICKKCGIEKPFNADNFHKQRMAKGWLPCGNICKACSTIRYNEWKIETGRTKVKVVQEGIIYDILTKEFLSDREVRGRRKICKAIGRLNSLLNGGVQHLAGRYVLAKNRHLLFTLVDFHTKEEFECINNKTILIHLGLPTRGGSVITHHLTAIKSKRMNYVTINGRIFSLKGNDKPPILRGQIKDLADSEIREMKSNESSRTCTKCGQEKSLERLNFHPLKSKTLGVIYLRECRVCRAEKIRLWGYESGRHKPKVDNFRVEGGVKYKTCRVCGVEKEMTPKLFPVGARCRECLNESARERFHKNMENPEAVEKHNAKGRKWAKENPEYSKMKSLKNYWKDPEWSRKKANEYRKLESSKIKRREKENRQRREDIYYRLSKVMSCSLRGSLKNKNKQRTFEILNFTCQELKDHLERLFTPDMSWKDYGGKYGIEIDHILPVTLFRYRSKNDLEFRLCWSLTNLQPLWGEDNSIKGDRLPDGRRARDLTEQERRDYILALFPSVKPEQLTPTPIEFPPDA